MNLKQMRLGILLSPTTPMWTGTVTSYNDATFTLTVATVSGSLSADYVGLALETSGGEWLRIRSINVGAGTIELAENGNSDDVGFAFEAGKTVSIYNVRIPLPRYQRITEAAIESDDDFNQLSDWVINGATEENTVFLEIYWKIEAAGAGTRVTIYWDVLLTDIIAQGTMAGTTGTLTLLEKNGSGISGSVYVTDPGGGIQLDDGSLLCNQTVVYKDYDIAFEDLGADPDTSMQGPIGICEPAMAWCDTNEEVDFDASESYATFNGWNAGARNPSSIVAYAWDAGAGGVVVAGAATATPTIKWTTAGFRYLKLTVTSLDSVFLNNVTQDRYIPIWVGITPYGTSGGVSKCSYLQQLGKGGQIEIEVSIPPTHLRYALCAVVNLETQAILFSGFIWPKNVSYDFERQTATFTVLSDMAFLQNVYSYPFRIEGVKGGPVEWNAFDMNSIFRGCFFLLRWHSNYLEIANVRFGTVTGTTLDDDRLEYIRDFTAGTILDQVIDITDSVFYGLYSNRISGFLGIPNWLYQASMTTLAADAVTLTLTNVDMVEDVVKELPVRQLSDVRLSGFYHTPAPDLDFFPIIIRGPIHPDSWGKPGEVTGLLASEIGSYSGYQEMLVWCGRHLGVENSAERFTIILHTDDVVLTDYQMVDLPTGERVMIEEQRIEYDPDGMFWKETIVGRTFGVTETSNVENPPPVPEKPVDPPVIPPDPEPEPVHKVMVGTTYYGCWVTDEFGDMTSSDPVWSAANDALTDLTVRVLQVDPFVPVSYQYLLTETTREVWARPGAGNWVKSLSNADALTECDTVYNTTYGNPYHIDLVIITWIYVDKSNGDLWAQMVGRDSITSTYWGIFYMQSTDNGTSWNTPKLFFDQYNITLKNFIIEGNYGFFGNRQGFGSQNQYVHDTIDAFTSQHKYTNSLGAGADLPWVCYAGTMDYTYINSAYGGLFALVDLERVEDLGNVLLDDTLLQGPLDIGPQRPDAYWYDTTDAAHQRVLVGYALYVTTDSWATVVDSTPAAISKDPTSMRTSPTDADFIMLGTTAAAGQPHVILLIDSETETTPVDKAGVSPGTAPFTNSIPWKDPTATFFNGVCYEGIQVLD